MGCVEASQPEAVCAMNMTLCKPDQKSMIYKDVLELIKLIMTSNYMSSMEKRAGLKIHFVVKFQIK